MPARGHTAKTVVYFILFTSILYIIVNCTNAYFLDPSDDEAARANARAWYEVLLRSKPQYGFARGSRSHGKPTFIRFGKRSSGAILDLNVASPTVPPSEKNHSI